jgi:hypothetical protein
MVDDKILVASASPALVFVSFKYPSSEPPILLGMS